ETIRQLEREYPKSRWVKPAQSLRVEIAERLHRNDVLWYMVAPPPPPAPPASPSTDGAPPPVPPKPPAPGRMMRRSRAGAAPPAPPPPGQPAVPPNLLEFPAPPAMWVSEHFFPDRDVQIQALGSLIRVEPARVIPMLRTLALESDSTAEA